ncbi:MAG: hypothetical protein NXI00_12245 [Cytophagales bacterium]|nr:hypothetical protein [Cytophagales bacterium]
MTEKDINDIYITLISAQFLLDHIEGTMGDKPGWIKHDLKSSMKTLNKKLEKLVDVPFSQDSVNVSSEVMEQHYQGSLMAEKAFRAALALSELTAENQLKFMASYENLCTRFGMKLD